VHARRHERGRALKLFKRASVKHFSRLRFYLGEEYMTGKFKCALIGCGLVLASTPALANKDWKEKDTNNDGRVSRAEFITDAEEKFSQMDTNNDSVLSENEFERHMEYKKDKKKDKNT
jgi:hypothetical protein